MNRYWIGERAPGVTHHTVARRTVGRRGPNEPMEPATLWTSCGQRLHVDRDGLPRTGLFISAERAVELGTVACGRCRFEQRREVA